MKILITGGTGTLGHEIVKQLWAKPTSVDAQTIDGCDWSAVDRIVIYSRGEQRQVEMSKEYPEYPKNVIRYDIGDIRDRDRLAQAMRGCDTVIHAAALKHVPVCEYNPQEAISTNVLGAKNVIEACNIAGVKKCIVVSTDKAVEPITLYGATKFAMEKMAIAANNLGSCRFSVVRYANVYGSNGSVIPIWRKQHAEGLPLTITDSKMTRMWITIEEAARFILSRFDLIQGGEVFVPRCHSENIVQTALKCLPVVEGHEHKVDFVETGIRPSEKLHETLISESDARDCWKMADRSYICFPPIHDWIACYKYPLVKMPETFRMCSNV